MRAALVAALAVGVLPGCSASPAAQAPPSSTAAPSSTAISPGAIRNPTSAQELYVRQYRQLFPDTSATDILLYAEADLHCRSIAHRTFADVVDQAVGLDGRSRPQAEQILRLAVITLCPQHKAQLSK